MIERRPRDRDAKQAMPVKSDRPIRPGHFRPRSVRLSQLRLLRGSRLLQITVHCLAAENCCQNPCGLNLRVRHSQNILR